MSTIQQEKIQLLDLAIDFNKFAKRNGWVLRYDTESDALSITVPKLSNDARIKYFNDDIAFYITKNNKLEGVFVEYFKTNFLKHHRNSKKIEKVLDNLEKKNKNDESLVKVNITELEGMVNDLQEAIRISLASRLNLSLTGA